MTVIHSTMRRFFYSRNFKCLIFTQLAGSAQLLSRIRVAWKSMLNLLAVPLLSLN